MFKGWILDLCKKVRYFWAMYIWTTLLRGVLSCYDLFSFFRHTLIVEQHSKSKTERPDTPRAEVTLHDAVLLGFLFSGTRDNIEQSNMRFTQV